MKCANVRLLGGGGGLESWRADALPASLHTVLIYFYMCVCVSECVWHILWLHALCICILYNFIAASIFSSSAVSLAFFSPFIRTKEVRTASPVPATRGRWQRSRRFQLLCFVFSLVANLFEYVCVWERECVQWVLSLSLSLSAFRQLVDRFCVPFYYARLFFWGNMFKRIWRMQTLCHASLATPLPACLHPSPH